MALVNAATVNLMRGDLGAAERAFGAALALDPALAAVHNGLGVIAARRSRDAEAVEHWRRAAAVDPGDYRTLFNLGSTLLRLGRHEEARSALEDYLRLAPPVAVARDRARVRSWLAQLG
jgi:Flp pilus assembly protein TadD